MLSPRLSLSLSLSLSLQVVNGAQCAKTTAPTASVGRIYRMIIRAPGFFFLLALFYHALLFPPGSWFSSPSLTFVSLSLFWYRLPILLSSLFKRSSPISR
jgi:hypothetical protein